MNNKKKGLIGLVFGAFLYYLMPLASALYITDFLSRGPSDLIQFIKDFTTPFFEAIIGPSSYEFFFAKILVLLLLFFLINFILKKTGIFQNQAGVVFIISAVVSILAIRFISENDFTLGILLPYGTVGVAISALVPFFLFFWLLHMVGVGGLGRRIGWGFYGIVFLSLWASRYSSISPVMNEIYGLTLFAIIVMLILDRKIHSYFELWEIRKLERTIDDRIILNLLHELEVAEQALARNPHLPAAQRQVALIKGQLHNRGIGGF